MNCTICGKPIVLVPSATERAKRYGGKAEDYTKLFQQHPNCLIAKRQRDVSEMIYRMRVA